ncbi:MAG: 3-methyl-2-oxobutanoate hydroxymethyltransferase [Bacteroidetes bacterium]|nr:3-methyl-2-oxobutanoate hydroxymethyltransferase [Bacteroidota bacterium]
MSSHKSIAKITTEQLRKMKDSGEKIAALTAYDFIMASLLDDCGIDVILVGDSASTVFAGNDTTLPMTMDQMVYHTQVVSKAVKRALVVADMPFMSYQVSLEDAIRNAGRFMKEGYAEAIKMEGGSEFTPVVKRIVEIGIPVMGHLGLTPQSIHKFGTYRTRGVSAGEAQKIVKDAKALESAGAFAIVLEKIPSALARKVSNSLQIPTIGIGAGPHCDGQILVSHDMLGLYEKFQPRFVRRYATMAQSMREAFSNYTVDVKKKRFPNSKESY